MEKTLPEKIAAEFALSVEKGLQKEPKQLDCRYLYDDRGSRLFELICEQPEYYLTREEQSILEKHSVDIASITGPAALLEFGSGNSMKTKTLLSAYAGLYDEALYIPVDISSSVLEKAKTRLAKEVPQAEVRTFHGTYKDAFHLFGLASPLVFLFMGSSLGNMDLSEEHEFWTGLNSRLSLGDFCLLGMDVNQDEDMLHHAYNDAAGYSAEFTKNIFSRMNKELDCGLDLELIKHRAFYNPEQRRVEIYAEFLESQEIRLPHLEDAIAIARGELVRTEISRKFSVRDTSEYLDIFGLKTVSVFLSESGRFALLLLQKV